MQSFLVWVDAKLFCQWRYLLINYWSKKYCCFLFIHDKKHDFCTQKYVYIYFSFFLSGW